MSINIKMCGCCPYNNQAKYNVTLSKNIQYIWNKKNKGPLCIEDNNSDILLVFEAPGIDEWSKNKPIISNQRGSAARKLKVAMLVAGKKREAYDITEAVRCFPGTSKGERNRKILKEIDAAANFCIGYLELDILSKEYRKIICFGSVAYNSVMKIYSKLKNTHSQFNTSYAQSKFDK